MTTATANIADLKQPIAPRETRLPTVQPGLGDLASFELMQRIAKLFNASPLVPEIYRGPEGLPSTVIALNMAMRMKADPLMVMQNLYVVHGRPAWSAQFLIACFNQCGRFSAIRYRWQGEPHTKTWGCRAYATELDSGQEIIGPLVTMDTANVEGWSERNGSKWKTIPELMLTYRAAAWMIRTHAPELAMGLPTAEEAGDIIDVTPEPVTIAEAVNGKHAAPPESTVSPDEPAPKKRGRPPGVKRIDPDKQPEQTGPTYAEIAGWMNKASTKDEVDLAESLVDRAITEDQQRAELHDLAKACRLELGA